MRTKQMQEWGGKEKRSNTTFCVQYELFHFFSSSLFILKGKVTGGSR